MSEFAPLKFYRDYPRTDLHAYSIVERGNMADVAKPSLVIWISCAITGALLAWVGTGFFVFMVLSGTNVSDAELMAEMTDQKDPPPRDPTILRENYAHALIPFYFLLAQHPKVDKEAPDSLRQRHQIDFKIILGFQLFRFCLVAAGGYIFANKYYGKQPLVQAIVSCWK